MDDESPPRYLYQQWTVAELIDALKTLPPDTLFEVRLPNYLTVGISDPTPFDRPKLQKKAKAGA
jgi:hypothetical protein